MKALSFLRVFAPVSVAFMAACSTSENNGGNYSNETFANAEMYYFYDEFVPDVGSFGIALYNDHPGGDFTELYLDFASDYFEDALRAVPANGVYTLSDSFAENTFNNTYSTYTKSGPSGRIMLGVLGGQFSLSRSGSIYSLQYNVKLGDGSTLKGKYEGNIPGDYDPTISSDLTFDFNTMPESGMEVARREGNVWELLLRGEPIQGIIEGGEVGVVLMIHADRESWSLPTGSFMMAGDTKQMIKGTAEPASLYYSQMEGCFFTHSDGHISWAVPGDGFVEIAQEDDRYHVSFSFEDTNGHVVSGNYAGEIDVVWSTRTTTRTSAAPLSGRPFADAGRH